MTTYVITASNWDHASFWAAIVETAPGHTLDFSGLGPSFTLVADQSSGTLSISDGVTTFTVGEAGVTGTDANFGGATLLDYFTTISGVQGDDRVTGSAAAEVLDGNSGNDRMEGLGGNDTLYGNGGADQMDGGDGNDLVYGGAGGDEIYGGSGADALHGESDADTIHGEGGADFINGGAGADLIYGGADNDHLEGGWDDDGADTIWGGTGNDLVMSFGGADSIYGEAGSDWMDGGHGNDLIDGGAEDDRMIGDVGNDTLLGGAGYDDLSGGEDADSIDGGDDADRIWGNAGDTIFGGEGGDDNDTLYVSHVNFITYTTAESGTITFNSGDTLQFSGIEQIVELTPDGVVDGTAGDDEIGQFYFDADGEWIDNGDAIGESDGDSVRAGDGNDSVWSNDGNDTVHGEAGDDYIYVGAGDNVAFGGAGSDTIDGEWQNDTISGDDFVATGPNLIVNGSFEDTTGMNAGPSWGFSGTGGIAPGWTDATGHAIQFHDDGRGGLNATDGTNWLDLEADPGQNSAVSQTVAGVSDGQVYVLSFDAADLSDIDDGTTQDNQLQVIWNGDVVGTIDARDGSWTSYEFHLIGGAGDGTNTLTFAGLGDVSGIGASLDNVQMYAAAEGVGGDDSIDAWHGDDDIMAGAGNDTILAGDGADLVVAGSGHDSVLGGDGDDTIWGGTGNDVADGGGVHTSVVSEEDFSTTPTGWFNPVTGVAITDTAALNDGNAFLGNFTVNGTGAEQVSKTFTLIEGATSAEIAFDFLKLDSWDESGGSAGTNERFIVYLDGTAVFSFTPDGAGTGFGNGADASGSFAGGTWSVTSSGSDTEMFGTNLPSWGERGYQVRITLDTPGDTVRLGIGTTLNQAGADESWGIDNVRVEAARTMPADGADTIDAGAGNDLVHGGAGDDSISGGAGNDTLYGGAGNDTLTAGNNTGAGDSLVGGAGNDVLNDSFWNATLEGGDDADLFNMGFGTATVTGGEGGTDNDTLSFAAANDAVTITLSADEAGFYSDSDGDSGIFSEIEAFELTSRDDTLNAAGDATGIEVFAGGGADQISGGSGNDSIDGGSGNDTLRGREGDDTILGGDGQNYLHGDAGNDSLVGNSSDNFTNMEGGAGADTLDGSAGIWDIANYFHSAGAVNIDLSDGLAEIGGDAQGDVLIGIEQVDGSNLGNDTIIADDSGMQIKGWGGNDSLAGGAGMDSLEGDDGNDTLSGREGDDTILGGAGDDSIRVTSGNDTVDAGEDNDIVVVTESSGTSTIDGGLGADTIDFSTELEVSGWTITATGEGAGTGTHSGGSAVTYSNMETILGSSNDDLIDLSADTTGVYAAAEDGNDTLIGGIGNDNLRGRSGNDNINTGDGNDTVSGGDGADIIAGGTGADLLEGGADADTFVVNDGFGNDTIIGGDTFTTGQNFDTIDLSALSNPVVVVFDGPNSGTITDFVTGEVITFSGIENLILTGHNDLVDATLDDGSTFIVSGAGADTVTTSDSSQSGIYGDAGDDLITTGAGDDWIEGGDGDDTIVLNGGADVVQGMDGADSYIVGAGFGGTHIDGGMGYDLIDLNALPNGVEVVFSGPGIGTITDRVTGDVMTIENVQQLILTDHDDIVDATLDDGHTYIQTRDGDDFVQGSPGDDIYDDEIFGPNGAGNDTFVGGDGNDLIWAGTDDDSVSGGGGDDRIEGQSGNDTLDGETGADTLYGDLGDDSITGGDGDDLIQEFSPGGTVVTDGDTVTGTNANEAFVFSGAPGTSATIILDDGTGTANDGDVEYDAVFVTSTGDGAALTLEGFSYGVDRVQVSEQWTGLSTSEIAAGHHQVTLTYDNGNSQTFDIFHDNGSVFDPALVMFTYAGRDTLEGGAGNDTIDGAFGDDTITGGTGDDSVLGGAGDDTIGLANTHGADTILGGEDADGADRDVLDLYDLGSGQGATVTYTGNEAGEVEFASAPGVISEFSEIEMMDGTNEADLIDAGVTTDGVEVYSNWGDDTVIGGSGADTIYAGLGADSLAGGDGADLLAGQEGDDTLDGGAGDDTLSGGGGQDSILGGDGDDLIIGDVATGGTFGLFALASAGTTGLLVNGTFGFNGSAPVTTVTVSDDEAAFEDLNSSGGSTQDQGAPQVLSSAITINGITYPAGTTIHAIAQSDIVNTTTGETGNAWLIQLGPTQAGNTYWAYDIAVNDGDQIGWTSSNDITIQNPIFANSTGLDYADLVQADGQPLPSSDTLSGGAGSDTIRAGAGDDSLSGGDGADSILGGDGADRIDGGTGNDTIDGGAGDDLIFGWTGDDSITGGQGDDTIFGQDGDDTILGGVGADSLDGDDAGTLVLSIGGTDRNGIPPEFEVRIDGVLVHTGTVSWAQDGAAPFDPGLPGAFQDVVIALPGGAPGTVSVTFTNDFVPGDATVPGEDRNLYLDGIRVGETRYEAETDATIINGGGVSGQHVNLWGTGSTASFDTSGAVVGGADSIDGGAGNDTLIGDGGNDTLTGGADDDVIFAGADDDSVSGGAGNDQIFGEGGNDLISADAGDDTVLGGDGDDTIFGFEGSDSVLGGAGDDVINTRTSPGTGMPDEGFPGFYPADADPTNDTDFVDGGTGNDLILTGDDDDTIFGGDGTDTIDAGFDDDLISGGAGADRIEGSEGNDTIDGGADGDVIYGDVSPDNPDYGLYTPFELPNDGTDLAPGNNADSLSGDDGNDTIFGQDDNDTLMGGAGDDLLDGGVDDDLLDGGDGADTLRGGQGNDMLLGGGDASADLLDGGDGDDELSAGGGNDTLQGGAGADSLFAAEGADILDGGSGDDTLDGWEGDDTITGGVGNDLITGGNGNDTFTYAVGDGLDTITDFNFGNTGTLDDGDATNNDFVNLSAFYDNIAELQDDYADDGILNQSNEGNTVRGAIVDYADNTRFDTDGIADNEGIAFLGQTPDGTSFTQENTGVICFTPGTLILTETGACPVEHLRPGDRIVTRDNGLQTLHWLAQRRIGPAELLSNPRLRPVLIHPDLIGAGNPLLVSPQHGVLLRNDTGDEILVRAIHLARRQGGKARVARGIRAVTYIHLMFDAHQIVFANGAPTESFYPGPMALAALSDPARNELGAIFPDLFSKPAAQIFGKRARGFTRPNDLPPSLHDLRAA